MTVTLYLGVSNFQRAISMVIPRSRSAFSLSRTHAYLNLVVSIRPRREGENKLEAIQREDGKGG
jgi:hypothetical protein